MDPPAIVYKLIIPRLRVSKVSLTMDQLLTKRIDFWSNF